MHTQDVDAALEAELQATSELPEFQALDQPEAAGATTTHHPTCSHHQRGTRARL